MIRRKNSNSIKASKYEKMDKKNIKWLMQKDLDSKLKVFNKKKKRVGLLMLAENAVNLGPPDLAKNFDKYFEESLK